MGWWRVQKQRWVDQIHKELRLSKEVTKCIWGWLSDTNGNIQNLPDPLGGRSDFPTQFFVRPEKTVHWE